jgi:uroporphyrinogen III methyltransferase/synthase
VSTDQTFASSDQTFVWSDQTFASSDQTAVTTEVTLASRPRLLYDGAMALGLVSFVSLGPGDPALTGARAAARLAGADVVVRAGEGATAEDLVAHARAGKRVVRIADGDALESVGVVAEVLAVARSGVPFEIVPGIGARSAAAAFAGVVGRATRATPDQVAAAVERQPPEAVVTLVVGVGAPSQQVIVTTAGEAVSRAAELDPATEVIVAIGAPDDELRWFERRPLFGKRVLVTRPREQAQAMVDELSDEGAVPVVAPSIVLRPPSDPAPLQRALEKVGRGEIGWVAFTSANGVERTWDVLAAGGGDARAFGGAKLAAIGPATAAALGKHGLRADVTAEDFRGEGLAAVMLAAMKDGPQRVLLARAARARDVLPEALRAAGHEVEIVAVYETHPAPPQALEATVRDLQAGAIDAVTFTSSSTVEHLCDALGPHAPEILARARVASIGPVTSDSARARGVRVDVEARKYTVPGLVRALADSYREPVA